jgi:hypothetical protein
MNADGRVTRKTLASQLDRLDQILDGLSDGLQEAITAAVQEAVGAAVREAVRAVLAELLTNPAVLERLQATTPPAAVAPEALAAPARTSGSRVWAWLSARMRALRQTVAAGFQRVRDGAVAVRACLGVVRPYRNPLLVAAGVGVLAGALAYLAGPWLASVASGLGGFATTLLVQAGLWLRRTLGTLPTAEA